MGVLAHTGGLAALSKVGESHNGKLPSRDRRELFIPMLWSSDTSISDIWL